MKIYFSLALDPRVLKDNLQMYKSYFKLWKKSGGQLRWKDIFEGKYRIVLPLSSNSIEKAVKEELQKNNVILLSYKENKAKDKYGREVKISKLLKGDLLQKYNADPLRQGGDQATEGSSEGKVVVISRHPIDVVSMSTGAHWSSCMTIGHKNYVPVTKGTYTARINSYINEGGYVNKLKDDVKEGTIIAYVVDATDTKTLSRPYCRIAIKPFVNKVDKNDIILVPEEKDYGDYVAGFREAVVNWLESKFQLAGEIYQKNKKVYNDDEKTIKIGKILDENFNDYSIEKQLKIIKSMNNPPEPMQLTMVKKYGHYIQYISNPNEKVQLEAIKNDPLSIRWIKHPTRNVQLLALSQEVPTFFFISIKNPIPEVIERMKDKVKLC